MILQPVSLLVGTLTFWKGLEAAPHVVQPLNPLGNLGYLNGLSANAPLLDLSISVPSEKQNGDSTSIKLTPQALPPGLVNSPYSIDLPEGLKFNAVNDIVYEGYASLMRDYSNSCQEAIRRIDREFPDVKNCSDENGLYFSQLDTICSEECLETTVNASKIIVEACNQEDTEGLVADRSYASWADHDTAKAACEPVDFAENKRCLEVVIEANINRENLKYKENAKPSEYKKVLCLPCTEEFYLATREAEDIPSLYFNAISEPEELFHAFETYCGYKLVDKPEADPEPVMPKESKQVESGPAPVNAVQKLDHGIKGALGGLVG
ncbi:hypothetical protein K493DRAFT_304186 [Basidiobolus meristosporus CBS 931.73]|uniref:Uncharacterized protein n=1 Tax=Basidiobolus meristosporus CBS 931.73 TaxID=1314790 RepID=A0A1Y1XZT5_9FUNG|nr:hypothetical protein K493DRAFT_304186 [Basidiobolus meristosporus CBS 931.73]|eukprot:ORX91273.1 hypothetical protein K493DRAFT_304186 [Basidiobolus meristosporus CBS 931.73]